MIKHLVFVILSLLLLHLETKTATSLGHQLASIEGGDANGAIRKCVDKERLALLEFKAGLKDATDCLSTWRAQDDCCKWNGVTCNTQTGHVTKLDLSVYMDQFCGKVSHSLLNLTYLNHLDLSYNFFNGTIPKFIGSLTKLRYLDLSDNFFNETIPKSIGSLTKLRYLNLSSNDLSGTIPKFELGNLTNLNILDISKNHFNGTIPKSIGSLSKLRYLDLSNTNHSGTIPPELGNLTNLQKLDVSHNQLYGIISEKIWKLPKLEYLDVSSNSFSNNSLEVVPFETQMSNLSYLYHLALNSYGLGPRFPKWIQTLKNLTDLDIGNSRISDTIPVGFWKMWPSQLTYLNLSSNNISGKSPDLTSNFGQRAILDLSSNNFNGPIPNVPSSLLSLNLSKNKFEGGISFLCQMVDGFLTFLDLSHNSFSGQLPDCLSHFKNLRVLNVGDNNLFGRIPTSIGSLFQLEGLYLCTNNFFGELPLSLENCTNLKVLNLEVNRFYGKVPAWIGENLSQLYALSLRSNNFFGPIPSQLCQLVNLRIIDLSMNSLYGTIPTCVNNLTSMVQEKLSHSQSVHNYFVHDTLVILNYIDQAIIEWQGIEREFSSNLGFLKFIDLSSNNLTGEIPCELMDLFQLFALNLSKNSLHGKIPKNIGQMKKLLTLDLSRNNFSGNIPSSMSTMTSLNWIDLSYNKLSGRIPTSTQLQSFDRSRYIGNLGLCGLPVTKICPGDKAINENEGRGEDIDELQRWFYISGGIGFATGFWIACSILLINPCGRHVFFCFIDNVND